MTTQEQIEQLTEYSGWIPDPKVTGVGQRFQAQRRDQAQQALPAYQRQFQYEQQRERETSSHLAAVQAQQEAELGAI